MSTTKMKIVMMTVGDIKPYKNNPRIVTTDAIAEVARSIKEYGFRQPIVVDKDHVIVIGHVRHLAAQALELKEVPVHVADTLTPGEAQAYRITDNRTATLSAWDYSTLISEIMSLNLEDEPLPGWSPDELEHMLPSNISSPHQVTKTEFDGATEGSDDYFKRQGVRDYQHIDCPACKHGFDVVA